MRRSGPNPRGSVTSEARNATRYGKEEREYAEPQRHTAPGAKAGTATRSICKGRHLSPADQELASLESIYPGLADEPIELESPGPGLE